MLIPLESHSPGNTALRAMWLPGAIPPSDGFTASQCPWAGRAGAVRVGWKGGRGAIKLGHKAAQRCWSNHTKAEEAWPHFHSLALPDIISTRLCPHRDTRAGTGAHGQQGLALLRVINHVLFDPNLSRAAAEGCAYQGMCCAFSAFQLCQDW